MNPFDRIAQLFARVLTGRPWARYLMLPAALAAGLAQAVTVTDGNISISGASGTGGAYKIGDSVTAAWNNTGTGDGNGNTITSVTVNFNQFGCGSAVAAGHPSGSQIWTAICNITPGSIDATNRNVSVTATDGTTTTTTADTTNATVDNIAPTLTDARIGISGASGTGGIYRIGDTVTATWNNTGAGDNNSDTISAVSVDFSQFGGGAAVSASNSSGTWTATYVIVAGAINGTNDRNVSITAADNAGNTTTTADSTNATVDNVAPAVSSVSVPSGGTYVAGQNLVFTVNTSENVTVNTTGGTPGLTLIIGATAKSAAYISGSGTSALVFRYTVESGLTDTDGIALDGSVSLNSGTMKDGAGNDLHTALNAIGGLTSVLVAGAPSSATSAASSISMTGATLNGTASANGASTNVSFAYGPTTGYGSSTTATQSPLDAGASGSAVSAGVSGLSCSTTYHYRVVATNNLGTTYGADNTFTTSACPVVSGECGSALLPSPAFALSRPTGDFCTAGTYSASPNGDTASQYNWRCDGSNGGRTAVCFARRGYSVTPSAGANVSLAPGNAQAVAYGQEANFRVTAEFGYAVYKVEGCDGTYDASTGTYTTGPITGNCAVTAAAISITSLIPAQFCATTEGEIASRTIVGTLSAAGKDHGKTGKIYVAAVVPPGFAAESPSDTPDRVFLVDSSGGWVKFNEDNPAYYAIPGNLGQHSFDVVTNFDLSAFTGTQIYLGYGVGAADSDPSESWNDMLNKGTYKLVHTVNGDSMPPRASEIDTGTTKVSGGTTDATITGGVTNDGGATMSLSGSTFSASDSLDVSATINPDPYDVGRTGRLLVVVSLDETLLMKDATGAWQPWDGNTGSLVAADGPRTLESVEKIPVASCLTGLRGSFSMYVGYAVGDEVIYSVSPIRFAVQ